MSPRGRTVLSDVTLAYQDSQSRYRQYADRGDFLKADIYLAEMQEMERCVTVTENSTAWRRTISERVNREQAGRR